MKTSAVADIGLAATVAGMALVILDLGRTHCSDALTDVRAIFDEDPIPYGNDVPPNLVEAAVRCVGRQAAEDAIARLTERAESAGGAWALGLTARSRALLAGDEGGPHYRKAIDLLGTTRQVVETARSRLLCGEWLRR